MSSEHREENIKKVTVEYSNGLTEVYDGLEDEHKNVVVSIVTVDNLEDAEDESGRIEAMINSSDFAVEVLIKKLRAHLIEHGDGQPTLEDFMEMLGL